MAFYVISDPHGEYERFKRLVDMIGLTEADTLYILGDVIDRGREVGSLIRAVMGMPNVRMLLGNHEYMCLQSFAPGALEIDRRRWNRNGNYTTLAALAAFSPEEQGRVLDFFRSLPDQAEVTVNGHKFLLVHGFVGETTHDRVWNRPTRDTPPVFDDGTTVVIGHTPVCEYVCPGSDEDQYVYSRRLTDAGDHFRIFHAPAFIDIDCCCGYGMSAARLACLRLDDMEEFYV